jgi:arsenite methyltransferase
VYGVVLAVLGATLLDAVRHHRSASAVLAGLALVVVVGSAVSYGYSTWRGKFSVWAQVLDELNLRGDEDVLDVGCGRGAVLILAAHRLPRGKTVGADLWRRRDQSGNSRAAAERNAVVEVVRDRLDLVDADARDLPIPSASFDVVVSNLTIHNMAGTEGRRQGLHETVRVLRPGGRIRVVDPGASRYAEVLRNAGCVEVTVSRLDWRTWCGIPGHHLVLVTASKATD